MIFSRLAMALLLAAGAGAFVWTARRRWKLMFAAQAPADRSDRMGKRVRNVLYYMFGQARMFRYRSAGVAHAFIFLGFVVLGLRTLILMARGFVSDPGFGFWLFDDGTWLGRAYLVLKDVFSGLVIAGVTYFLIQRLIVKPRRMELSVEGVAILCMILGLMLADLTYEAAAINAASHAGADWIKVPYTPTAFAWAILLRPLPVGLQAWLSQAGFWMHTLIVLTFLNFLPYGKHFHILTVLPNVLTSNSATVGLLRGIADLEGRIEREQSLGLRTVQDLHWKDVLDLYTCTECGRCSDHCPAFNTGKRLSPKHLSMALRDHLYEKEEFLINLPRKGGPHAAGPGGSTVAEPPASLKEQEPFQLVPAVIDPRVIWACTTCGACEQECPVFISYVDKIVGMRQTMVQEKGEFPEQLQNAFRGLETVGNPYSLDNGQRAEWAVGLDVPLRSEKPDAEYLFWVGCSPSYDDRARRIARSTARLFKAAGVDFAILGPEETCNGDPARRAGNEFLFQTLAKQNVETLQRYSVRKIVTTCPHCFNMLAREYPEFGGRFEVIHHTVLLHNLVQAGKLRPSQSIEATIAYHDSCYIGRYHGVYDAPREILRSIPGVQLVDAPESRSRGMCCGAGGAQMWKEEEPIERPGSREGDGKVNHARARQLLRVLPPNGAPRKVASACPFCKTMLSDALRDQGHEDVEQRDVAEYLAASVLGPENGEAAQA